MLSMSDAKVVAMLLVILLITSTPFTVFSATATTNEQGIAATTITLTQPAGAPGVTVDLKVIQFSFLQL